jgi:hypothetical protein
MDMKVIVLSGTPIKVISVVDRTQKEEKIILQKKWQSYGVKVVWLAPYQGRYTGPRLEGRPHDPKRNASLEKRRKNES